MNQNNKSYLKLIGFFCISLSMFNCAYGLKSDESKPLQIDANHATFADQTTKVTTFTGNVVITKGSFVVHANTAVASEDVNKDRILTLDGAPVTFSQLADDGQKIEGQGNHFVYNTKTNLAVLSGRSRIKKGNNSIIGDTITYNTKTQIYSAVSGRANGVSKKSQGRITVILDQNNESGNPIKR